MPAPIVIVNPEPNAGRSGLLPAPGTCPTSASGLAPPKPAPAGRFGHLLAELCNVIVR